MPINREFVDKFLTEVDAQIVSTITAGAPKLQGHQKLLAKYHAACAAWHSESVNHVQGITATVNELCVAKLILDDKKVTSASYEPQLEGTAKTIDFLVCLVGTEARIFYDVKTVQPEKGDAWNRYENMKSKGWFTPHTSLELEQEGMGGEIAHELFASREKFLDYTLELEAKIQSLPMQTLTNFRLIFCGNGIQWQRDHLEDFAAFYFSGHSRADDTLGSMQSHYMAEKGITFDRSIHEFCYFARERLKTEIDVFGCDVRGPRLPWEGAHEG